MNGQTNPPLSQVLDGVLRSQPAPEAARQLLNTCHQLAVAYLRRRSQAGRLDPSLFGLSIEDLALDCVAELFRRNDDGRFVQFESYFDGPTRSAASDSTLEIALRRIVFSAVNEGLFRRYRELDPSLGRLIRSIKRHIAGGGDLELNRDQSMPLLELRGSRGSGGKSRPFIPQDLLEIHLHHAHSGKVTVESVLQVVSDLLKNSGEYAPSLPVTEVALAMRSVLTRLNIPEDEEESDLEGSYESIDLSNVVRTHVTHCTSEMMESMQDLYVKERGIAPGLFRAYFRAAEDLLITNYVDPLRPKESFRVALCRHIGETSTAVYRKKHQAILEYIVKITQRQVLSRVASLI